MIDDDVLRIAEKLGGADNPHEVMVIQKTLEEMQNDDPFVRIANSLEFFEFITYDFIRFIKAAAVGGMALTVVYFLLRIYGVF